MPRKARWNESPIVNEIGEVRLLSWKYFADYIYQEMLEHSTYIWRGQRCDNWKLDTTLDRLIHRSRVNRLRYHNFVSKHLERFKYASRGRRGNTPHSIDDENDWWALGQHHGLATPLLDWTTSPFVAAYFAFIGIGENQTQYRTVFALHRPSIEALVTKMKKASEAENKAKLQAHMDGTKKIVNSFTLSVLKAPVKRQIEFIRPMSDENQRLVNQGGLFTRSPIGEDLEAWINRNHTGDSGYTLMKISIPDKDRAMSLKMLNRMNINHLSLFPDLYGASKFCNIYGEIDKY